MQMRKIGKIVLGSSASESFLGLSRMEKVEWTPLMVAFAHGRTEHLGRELRYADERMERQRQRIALPETQGEG